MQKNTLKSIEIQEWSSKLLQDRSCDRFMMVLAQRWIYWLECASWWCEFTDNYGYTFEMGHQARCSAFGVHNRDFGE